MQPSGDLVRKNCLEKDQSIVKMLHISYLITHIYKFLHISRKAPSEFRKFSRLNQLLMYLSMGYILQVNRKKKQD